MFYRDLVLGCDPTDVERVMLQVRRVGAFKPWGTAVSMIESPGRPSIVVTVPLSAV